MNQFLTRLETATRRDHRLFIGLMSGTSFDGVDMVLVRCSASGRGTKVEILESAAFEWPAEVRGVFFRNAYQPDAAVERILDLDKLLTDVLNGFILKALDDWKVEADSIDAIANPGQTVFHRAGGQPPVTLQLMNGSGIAVRTRIPVVGEFRRHHIALGMEGAPLVPLAEALLYQHASEDRVLVNLGGIANLTWLPAAGGDSGGSSPAGGNAVGQVESGAASSNTSTGGGAPMEYGSTTSPSPIPFATDTGPANTLIDRFVRELYPSSGFDKDGHIAEGGEIHQELLQRLLDHPFFKRQKPTSTGPEEFSAQWVVECVEFIGHTVDQVPAKNLIRTLTELTVQSLCASIQDLADSGNVFVSGGGARNSFLMKRLSQELQSFRVQDSTALGIPVELKEAVLFTVLANEFLAGPGWVHPRLGTPFTLGTLFLP